MKNLFILGLIGLLVACGDRPKELDLTETTHVFLLTGDSTMKGNQVGVVPTGIPVATAFMPAWIAQVDDNPNPNPNTFHDLNINSFDNTYGPELSLGLELYNTGIPSVIIKLYRGSSSIDQFLPGGPHYNPFIAQLTAAKTAVDLLTKHETIWHWVDKRGVTELQSANSNASVNFGPRMTELRDEIGEVIGQTPRVHCVLTSSETVGANVEINLPVLRASQIDNSDYQINVDSAELQNDSVHPTFNAQNENGTQIFVSVLEEIKG